MTSTSVSITGIGASGLAGQLGIGGTTSSHYETAQTIFYAAEISASTNAGGTVTTTFSQSHGSHTHGALSNTVDTLAVASTTFYASDLGYRTVPPTDGDPVAYPPLINQAFAINRAMNLSPGDSSVAASWGTLTLSNANGLWNTTVSAWNNAGRNINIFYGLKNLETARNILIDPPYASLVPLLKGIQTSWFLSETELQIPLRDATYWLEQPVQQNQYSGLGTYGGTANLTGLPLPMLRGGNVLAPVKNITPVLIDPTNLIYQYTDYAGTVSTIYEGAYAAFASSGDTANLYSGSTAAGHYRTDNSRGLFQLGSTPVNAITIDGTGAFSGGAQTSVVQMVKQFLIDAGVPSSYFSTSQFNSVAGAFPYTAGIYFSPNDNPSGLDAISKLLASVGGKLIADRTGLLKVFVIRAPGQVTGVSNGVAVATFNTVNATDVTPVALPSAVDPPIYRTRVGYQHNWTVQTSGYDGASTAAQQQFVSVPDSYASAISTTVQTNYARPNDLAPLITALLKSTEAQSVANDLLLLWGVRRRLYNVSVPIQFALARDISDLITLQWPLDDLIAGKLGWIVGETFSSTDSVVIYAVLC